MKKLLVINPQDEQEVIHVDEGGGYFDLSRVLWDERADGPMPEISLGVMTRQGNALVVDPSKVAGHQAREAAKTQAAAAKAARKARLKGSHADVNTVAELKALVLDLIAELNP